MVETNSSVQEMLNAALRKAEMQQLQLELEVRFKKNMEVFRQAAKPIYDQFINYQPEELRLSYDTDGHLNLVNYKLNNKPVYAEDPKVFTLKQVEDFARKPSITSITFAESRLINDKHIHAPLINDLIKTYASYNNSGNASLKPPIGVLLMTGCGLGYQIPLLMERADIRNLIIFDPHKDSFYASLHVIDWQPILHHFCQSGRMIKLQIGMESNDAMAELKLLPDKIGLHKLVYTYVFRHFNSEKADDFIQRYRKEFHLIASGIGFFDDEQISLAHTVQNLNNATPLFQHTPTATGLPAVFVVGNGPSLDKQIDFIQKNIKNVIVISCGTALGSLAKVGIKPDFHVEMERNFNIKAWISRGTTAEFRQNITLLCLNTVSPEVIDLFDEACIARKPNDLGEHIILDIKPEILALQLCNPTVTNAGLSFAISMGFKEIYLMGVDLGTAPDEQHHSKLSLHYDLENKTNDRSFSGFENPKNSYKLKGNFGGEVTSNVILDGTRFNMEILLRIASRSLGDVRCYNPNRGAYIEGAATIELSDIREFSEQISKPDIVQKIKDRNFIHYASPKISQKKFHDKYLRGFFGLRNQLRLAKEIHNATELFDELDRLMTAIIRLKEQDPIATFLLRGSLQGYFTLITKACMFQDNSANFKTAYTAGRSIYHQFLEKAYKIMDTEALRIDDTPDRVLIKLDKP